MMFEILKKRCPIFFSPKMNDGKGSPFDPGIRSTKRQAATHGVTALPCLCLTNV